MDKKEKDIQSTENTDHISDIKDIVAGLSSLIDEHPVLKNMSFGLFYQNGRIGFMDLDAFANSTKARLDKDGEEKNIAELKKDIDKNKK